MRDDKDEIMLIGWQLEQRRLYGAAQLIFQLARERDEARQQAATYKALLPRVRKSLLPKSMEEMARAQNLMNNDGYD